MTPCDLGATPCAVDAAAGLVLAVGNLVVVLAIGVLLHRWSLGKTLPGAQWVIAILALVALGCAQLSWSPLRGHVDAKKQ